MTERAWGWGWGLGLELPGLLGWGWRLGLAGLGAGLFGWAGGLGWWVWAESGGLGLGIWAGFGQGVGRGQEWLPLEPGAEVGALPLETDLSLGFVTGTWFWAGLGLKLTV